MDLSSSDSLRFHEFWNGHSLQFALTHRRFCIGTLPRCTLGGLRLIFFSFPGGLFLSVDFINKPFFCFVVSSRDNKKLKIRVREDLEVGSVGSTLMCIPSNCSRRGNALLGLCRVAQYCGILLMPLQRTRAYKEVQSS